MPDSTFSIRPARFEDAATIRRLVRGAGLDPTSLDWPNFFVAHRAGRIIGVGQVKPYPNSRELGSLVVLKPHRRQGVAAALINALVEPEQGELFLLCQQRMESYYARFGFGRVGLSQLRGAVRRKYLFTRVFRVFGVRIIAMRRPHPFPSPGP